MAASFKRKRTMGPSLVLARPYAPPRPIKRTKRMFTPGRDRVGGFYGRYAPTGGELKFHDVDLDDAFVATGGTVTPTINIIPQGVTESQRIGRKCTVKHISWRYRLNLPEADAQGDPTDPDSVRVLMYMDKQCNGATATVTDVLESADLHSFRNLSNSGRFVILLDKTYLMNPLTIASDGAGLMSTAGVVREYSFYKKCNIPIEFNSTTGAIAEIRSNNIATLLISSAGSSGFNSKIRLRFSDN